jgi:hypothetical protein
VNLYGASGEERTDTFGLRLRGWRGALDGSVGGIGQTGDATGRKVRASPCMATSAGASPACLGLPT